MPAITLKSRSGRRCTFACEEIHQGVALNPKLPPNFDSTPNEQRCDRAHAWWGVPYVQTHTDTDPKFVAYWGGAVRFDVRCLDGGAWDRSTNHGQYGTLEEAIQHALNMNL